MNKEPSIYKPEFIPYYPAVADKYGLNPVQALVYGFIRFYTSSTNNAFYFSNEQIGSMINRKERQISEAVNVLISTGIVTGKYETKTKGGQIRYLKVKIGHAENRASETRKVARQTSEKPRSNNNKRNENKGNKTTVPATPVVVIHNVEKSVDKSKGISSIGSLLANHKVPESNPKSRIHTPWQDHALRIADKLKIKVDPAWFKLFKDLTNSGKSGKLETAYSRTIDAGAKDPKKYFFGAVSH